MIELNTNKEKETMMNNYYLKYICKYFTWVDGDKHAGAAERARPTRAFGPLPIAIEGV